MQNRVNLYRFDMNLKVVDDGPCDCASALAMLVACSGRDAATFASAEAALSETSFGLSRSDRDFIEISMDGKGTVSIHSDRLHFPSWFSETFGLKRRFSIEGDSGLAKQVIQDYFRMDRLQFERAYSGSWRR